MPHFLNMSKFHRRSFRVPLLVSMLILGSFFIIHTSRECSPTGTEPDLIHRTISASNDPVHIGNPKYRLDSVEDSDTSNLARPVKAPLPKRKDYSPFCDPQDCGKGYWVPRASPFTTLAQVHSAFNSQFFPICSLNEPTNPAWTEEDRETIKANRYIKLSNWEWMPTKGDLLPWDPEAFIIRMFQSPGGLFLVGDSLSRQHLQSLTSMLHQSGLPIEEFKTETPPWTPSFHITEIRLFLHEPKTQALLKKAGVPASRAERPLMTMIEDHPLLLPDELRILARQKPGQYFNHLNPPPRVPLWQDYVESMIAPRAGEESLTKDSVVVVNAGAHWNYRELKNIVDDVEEYNHTMSLMIDKVVSRLSSYDRTTIYYRTTSPGHPGCETKLSPYESAEDAGIEEGDVDARSAAIAESRRKWGWGSFQHYNHIWKRAIEEANVQKEKLWKGDGATWKYLDIWDLSMQRPDAHTLWRVSDDVVIDCMHWCVPFVLREWTQLLAHDLFVDEHLRE